MLIRDYQARIVHEASATNAVVVLPTGAGKTLIAANVIKHILDKDDNHKALFLVPTCLLVNQVSERSFKPQYTTD